MVKVHGGVALVIPTGFTLTTLVSYAKLLQLLLAYGDL